LIANKAGWYWYQAPIETQALLIEAFTEVSITINQTTVTKNKTKNCQLNKIHHRSGICLTHARYRLVKLKKDNTIIKIETKNLTKNGLQTKKQ
jgi:hypothetical protein